MANMHDCIQRAIDSGDLDRSRGIEARRLFDEMVNVYASEFPIHQAQAMAAADLKEATKRAARSRFHMVVNQLQALRRIKRQIEGAPDPARALKAMLEFSVDSGHKGESVRFLAESYEAFMRADLQHFLRRTGLDVAGRSRNKALLLDIVRELHGEATGSADAADLAKGVARAYERMRQLFNAHGGDIGKLEGFGLPHRHDAEEIARAGFDKWAEFIAPKLAWERIIDRATGRAFAAAGEVPTGPAAQRFLKEVYDNITTRGWSSREPSLAVGGKALYNQRADHRVLHFKDGSGWIEYNQSFGGAEPFTAIIEGLRGLASDVAQMRVLGPNPRAGLDFAVQVAEKRAATSGDAKLARRVQRDASWARNMLAAQDGSASVPEDIALASFMRGTRNFAVSTQLGSAVISSLSDEVTSSLAAKVIGANPAGPFVRQMQLIASHATREDAARMGFIAETLADAASGSGRYFGKMVGGGVTGRLASITLRASGLNAMTDLRRVAFKLEMAGYLAGNAGREFSEIDMPLRRALEARGFIPGEWDALRSTLFTARNGSTFLAPWHWLENQTALPRAEAEGLALRLQSLFQERQELAIPTASLEGRAAFKGAARPGAIGGEFLNSALMYKSFAISMTLGQMRQLKTIQGAGAAAGYLATFAVAGVLSGALAIQLKELARGNDLRPMSDANFWGAALLQFGGLGIFGDFLSSSTSRIGGGLSETLAGPVVGLAGDVLTPVMSNASRAVDGKPILLGRDTANFVRYQTPVASTLWYSKLAWGRVIGDQLQSVLDPEAEAVWNRQARRQERDYGTRSWWRRGDPAPSRFPDLSNAGASR